MSLRLRLIVAFFFLSVVPLAAVTLFTYASNARAMREAAGREAELLAGELTQRMQVVTAQLSERVERLMDVAEARAEADAATAALETTASAERAAATAVPAPAATSGVTQETQVAQALGEMAMLLENVELRGLRGPRPGGGPPPSFSGRGRFSGPPPPGAPGHRTAGCRRSTVRDCRRCAFRGSRSRCRSIACSRRSRSNIRPPLRAPRGGPVSRDVEPRIRYCFDD